MAALLVVFGHARNFLFLDYTQLPHHPLWVSLFYLVTKAGHQSVIVFFVLSGYLISGSIFRALERHTWSWGSYLVHRLVRLWVVLLPGLLLCFALDHFAIAHHLAPSLYNAGAANHMSINVARNLTPVIFLQNLFFLGVLRGPVFGSNTALWSLPYEFWYYILFPLALFAFTRRLGLSTRLGIISLLVALACFSHVVLSLFPVWLAGTLLALAPVPRVTPGVRIMAGAIYTAVFLLSAGFEIRLPPLLGDYSLAIATVLFLWILLSATEQAAPSRSVRATQCLARFSYTLYVVHTPLLLLLTALAVGEHRWMPGLLTLFACCGIVAIVTAYAYAVASFTEFHTDALRVWIERQLGSKSLSPSLPL